jgi:glycosyltransferase involved in cell wall biosynthesis
MPIRDAGPHLDEALSSVSAQDYQNYELIVVDDGSRDGSCEQIVRRAAGDPRIRLLRQPRRGIARALDLALRHARGPLVARMDADDVALPHRFSTQVAYLEKHPRLAVVGSQVELFNDDEMANEGMDHYVKWLNSLTGPTAIERDLFVESPLCHPSVMARREVVMAAGGYRDVDGPEDYDLWLRMGRLGAPMAVLPKVLLRWRDSPGRATRKDRRYREKAIFRLKAAHLLHWRLGYRRDVSIWGAGPLGKRWARHLQRRGVTVHCFVDVNPRKVGQSIRGIPVIAPDQLPQRAPRGGPLLIAVGHGHARRRIRQFLTARGWQEPKEFFCLQ